MSIFVLSWMFLWLVLNNLTLNITSPIIVKQMLHHNLPQFKFQLLQLFLLYLFAIMILLNCYISHQYWAIWLLLTIWETILKLTLAVSKISDIIYLKTWKLFAFSLLHDLCIAFPIYQLVQIWLNLDSIQLKNSKH